MNGPVDLAQVAPIGQTIIRLGQARAAGKVTLADAIDQLIAAHPEAGFSRYGAELQLKTWDGAHLRYRPRTPTAAPTPRARSRSWRNEPIHLHLPAVGS